jgi:hypothetical protein
MTHGIVPVNEYIFGLDVFTGVWALSTQQFTQRIDRC